MNLFLAVEVFMLISKTNLKKSTIGKILGPKSVEKFESNDLIN